jgi:DNA-binding MarR family transcriptional regulator
VLEFMQRLWAVDHGLQSKSKCMALRILGRNPRISAGELAAIMHLHPSTLTGVLRRLEERGYIARRTDGEDRRRAILELTAQGRSIGALQAGTVEAALERVLSRVGPRRLETAAAVLSVVAEELASPD